MYACDSGHIDIVKLLIESGANLDVQDEDVKHDGVSEIIIINIMVVSIVL